MSSPSLQEGFFPARDNLRLYFQAHVPPAPRAAVIVLHGYADHSHRYMHVFRALNDQGLATWALDYRGHGQADGRRGHVDHFSDYVDDAALFLDRVRREKLPTFVLAHSHGALVFAMLALRDRPRDVEGVVYSSPFVRIAFRPPRAKVLAARVLNRVIPWIPFENTLKADQLSRDVDWQRATERDPLYNRTTTPRWFFEMEAAQETVLARAAELTTPALVLLGESDPISDPATIRAFHERLGTGDKKLLTYPGALHEILNESEPTRARALSDVSSWMLARTHPSNR